MSPDQVRKLVGGYATGTLTPEERQTLFEAALDDQQLFDALAREQSLRDLLGDPAAKAELLAALGDTPATWRERAARWMWGHVPVLAALACFVTVGGYVARQWRMASAPEVAVATPPEPAAPPRRVFDLNSVKKPAAPLPALPAPPVLTQAPMAAQAFPPAMLRGLAGGSARVPGPAGLAGGSARVPGPAAVPAAPAAPRQDVTVNGIVTLDTGGNLIQHFQPTGAAAEARPMQAVAGGPISGAAGGGGRGGGSGGMLTATPRAALGNTRLSAGAATGALTGEIAVTAAPTPVQTVTRESSTLADSSQFADLTLQGRDLFATMASIPPQAAPPAPVGAGKLDPALVALIRGAGISGAAGRGGASAGRSAATAVDVRITLTNASKDSLVQLKKAGVTIGNRKGNELTGRIDVQDLDTVAQLAFVVWIAPQ